MKTKLRNLIGKASAQNPVCVKFNNGCVEVFISIEKHESRRGVLRCRSVRGVGVFEGSTVVALLESVSRELLALQCELRQLDPNGWETLEDAEQNDAAILRDAIAYIRANS